MKKLVKEEKNLSKYENRTRQIKKIEHHIKPYYNTRIKFSNI
jgi:hypothetical protein